MPKINLPTLEGQDKSFAAIPAGQFRVAVDKVEENTPASGIPQLLWHLKITEVIRVNMNENPDPSVFVGQNILHGTSFSEDSLWNLHRTLMALGYDKEDIESEDFDFDSDDAAGRECVVTTRVQTTGEYAGNTQVSGIRALNMRELGQLA
jgi:hypothetical protein